MASPFATCLNDANLSIYSPTTTHNDSLPRTFAKFRGNYTKIYQCADGMGIAFDSHAYLGAIDREKNRVFRSFGLSDAASWRNYPISSSYAWRTKSENLNKTLGAVEEILSENPFKRNTRDTAVMAGVTGGFIAGIGTMLVNKRLIGGGIVGVLFGAAVYYGLKFLWEKPDKETNVFRLEREPVPNEVFDQLEAADKNNF